MYAYSHLKGFTIGYNMQNTRQNSLRSIQSTFASRFSNPTDLRPNTVKTRLEGLKQKSDRS